MPDLSGYRFTATHEWVRHDAGKVTVGISDGAQAQLGDVIFVELPAVGTRLRAGVKFGVVESVKAASDLYSPVSGTVSGVNDALTDTPELVNQSPYEAGWMVELTDVEDGGTELMDEAAYLAQADA
jgi:glycine cleavage system H protein